MNDKNLRVSLPQNNINEDNGNRETTAQVLKAAGAVVDTLRKIPGMGQYIDSIQDYFSAPFIANANAFQSIISAANAHYNQGGVDELGDFLKKAAESVRDNLDELKSIVTAVSYLDKSIAFGNIINHVYELAEKYGAVSPAMAPRSPDKAVDMILRKHLALAQAKIGSLLMATADAAMTVMEERPQSAMILALMLPATIGRSIDKQIKFIDTLGNTAFWGLNPFSRILKLAASGENPRIALGRLVYTAAFLSGKETAMKILSTIKEFFGALESKEEAWLYQVANSAELAAAAASAEIESLKTAYLESYTGAFWVSMSGIIPSLRDNISRDTSSELFNTIMLLQSQLILRAILNIKMRGGGDIKKTFTRNKRHTLAQQQNSSDNFGWMSAVTSSIAFLDFAGLASLLGTTDNAMQPMMDALGDFFKQVGIISNIMIETGTTQAKILANSGIFTSSLQNLLFVGARNSRILESQQRSKVEAVLMIIELAAKGYNKEIKKAIDWLSKNPNQPLPPNLLQKWGHIVNSVFKETPSSLPTVPGPQTARPGKTELDIFEVGRAANDIQTLINVWGVMDDKVDQMYNGLISTIQTTYTNPNIGSQFNAGPGIGSQRSNMFPGAVIESIDNFCNLLDLFFKQSNLIPAVLKSSRTSIERGEASNQERVIAATLAANIRNTLIKFLRFRVEAEIIKAKIPMENILRRADIKIKKYKADEALINNSMGPDISKALGPIGPANTMQAIYFVTMKKVDAYDEYIELLRTDVPLNIQKVVAVTSDPDYQFFIRLTARQFVASVSDFLNQQIEGAEADKSEALSEAVAGMNRYKGGTPI